ncbi:bifunctional phosphoglucose/phosphomannose isomerase [soil metagenome]
MMMDKLVAGFADQLREAIEIGRAVHLRPAVTEIRNIVVTGLGGSGIGGNLVSELANKELRVPFVVNKDYSLPHYVNENTLVICCSYSGNTEETLAAFSDALKANAHIICITSGGKLVELAKQYNLDHILIPGGNPPRACLGYSSVQLLFVLKQMGLISGKFEDDLDATIALLEREQDYIRSLAKEIAARLFNRIPVLYAVAEMESVAVRIRQQINENAKMLCWHHVVPEMNHNELVGWRNKIGNWAPIFLRSREDYERNQQRIEINKSIIAEHADHVLEIYAKGESHTERAYYLIHLGDWVSVYLAELNGVDAVEVKVIDFLKNELANS